MNISSQTIRRRVAELSPKSYAEIIIERNQAMLNFLVNEVKPAIESRKLYFHDEFSNSVGCPHCERNFPCHGCIWTKAAKDGCGEDYDDFYIDDCAPGETDHAMLCCDVQFNGVTFIDVTSSMQQHVSISYAAETESIYAWWDFRHIEDEEDVENDFKCVEEEYENCVKFLEGHIQWAKTKSWGKKVDQTT